MKLLLACDPGLVMGELFGLFLTGLLGGLLGLAAVLLGLRPGFDGEDGLESLLGDLGKVGDRLVGLPGLLDLGEGLRDVASGTSKEFPDFGRSFGAALAFRAGGTLATALPRGVNELERGEALGVVDRELDVERLGTT